MSGRGESTILNDEKNMVYLKGEEYVLAPTPWRGELPYVNNLTVPLNKLFFLEKDTVNKIEPVSVPEFYNMALRTCFMPFWDRDLLNKMAMRLERFLTASSDKLYRVSFNKDSDFLKYLQEHFSNA